MNNNKTFNEMSDSSMIIPDSKPSNFSSKSFAASVSNTTGRFYKVSKLEFNLKSIIQNSDISIEFTNFNKYLQNGAQSADTFKSLYKSQTEIIADESATDPDRIIQSIVDLCRILRMPETRLQTTDNIKGQSHEQRIAYYKQLPTIQGFTFYAHLYGKFIA